MICKKTNNWVKYGKSWTFTSIEQQIVQNRVFNFIKVDRDQFRANVINFVVIYI